MLFSHKIPFAAEHTKPPDTLPDRSHFAGTSTEGSFAFSEVTVMVPVSVDVGTGTVNFPLHVDFGMEAMTLAGQNVSGDDAIQFPSVTTVLNVYVPGDKDDTLSEAPEAIVKTELAILVAQGNE
jgi:hypothetical protein